MDKPSKIRLPNSDRLDHVGGRSSDQIGALNEGLTKMDLSRQVMRSALSSEEVEVGKSAYFSTFNSSYDGSSASSDKDEWNGFNFRENSRREV